MARRTAPAPGPPARARPASTATPPHPGHAAHRCTQPPEGAFQRCCAPPHSPQRACSRWSAAACSEAAFSEDSFFAAERRAFFGAHDSSAGSGQVRHARTSRPRSRNTAVGPPQLGHGHSTTAGFGGVNDGSPSVPESPPRSFP